MASSRLTCPAAQLVETHRIAPLIPAHRGESTDVLPSRHAGCQYMLRLCHGAIPERLVLQPPAHFTPSLAIE